MILTSQTRVAIIDDFHPVFMERLKQAGLLFDYNPEILPANVYDFIKDAAVVAVRSKVNFDKGLIERLPDLQCIARGGAGMDNIDEEFAREKGITLLNAPEGNRDAVAEHVVGLLLGLSKNIFTSAREVSLFQWNREANRGWELGGKTIGIIGFGNTGAAFAKKLSGFDCTVRAYDKFNPDFQSLYALPASLEEVLEKSDVISLHVPLNTSTKHMVDAGFISHMKNQAVLINSSRGKIVDAEAVLNALQAGKIRSFATDVLENEDFQNLKVEERNLISDLCATKQVIITPHIAGWSTESYKRIALVLAEKLAAFTTNIKNI